MKPVRWPHWIEETIWAKSADKGEQGKPESLARHTWTVLERLRDFVGLRPALPAELEWPELWNVLFWGAFFHDFGKALPGFQNMLRGKGRWGYRHEIFSLAFLSWVDEAFSERDRARLAAAIVSHHRDAEDIFTACPLLRPGEEEWLDNEFAQLDREHVSGLWRWVAQCSPDWIRYLGFDKVGVRAVRVCEEERAIASILSSGAKNVRIRLKYFRTLVRGQDEADIAQLVQGVMLRGHIINADHSASAHAGAYPRVRFQRDVIIERRKLDANKLYPHQLQSGQAPGNVLLSAPTGSGKTEASLFWAAGQAQPGFQPPRLFYTLPYQASMNAMARRLQGLFGEKLVGLQHGRSRLAIYRQLMERGEDPKSASEAARLARNLADLNYPPIRVFSPFQMLKAMYRLKGYEAQLLDYHRALFIFDEIHAYEVKRLAMILRSIAYLRQHYSARFFVMSATFPSLIKGWLQDALGEAVEIRAELGLFKSFQRHRLHIIDGDLLEREHLERIAGEALGGKSVLVVCNLVARAQQAYQALNPVLKPQGVPVILLHGRFNLRDRLAKENAIQELAGVDGAGQPFVLIATQVVEVSLDIDLNTIYSDPAPLEALVQRFGRVNRQRKLAELAPVHVFTEPEGGQKIYDPALVERAMHLLRREDGKPVDEMAIEGWLDEIYSGDISARWQAEFANAAKDFESACIQTLRPYQADASLEDEFYKAFDGIEVLPLPLYDEYERLRRETPIAAGELLVPVSWGRYHALVKDGQVLPRDKNFPVIVNTSYSSELGMTFDRAFGTEDDF